MAPLALCFTLSAASNACLRARGQDFQVGSVN